MSMVVLNIVVGLFQLPPAIINFAQGHTALGLVWTMCAVLWFSSAWIWYKRAKR